MEPWEMTSEQLTYVRSLLQSDNIEMRELGVSMINHGNENMYDDREEYIYAIDYELSNVQFYMKYGPNGKGKKKAGHEGDKSSLRYVR